MGRTYISDDNAEDQLEVLKEEQEKLTKMEAELDE